MVVDWLFHKDEHMTDDSFEGVGVSIREEPTILVESY